MEDDIFIVVVRVIVLDGNGVDEGRVVQIFVMFFFVSV